MESKTGLPESLSVEQGIEYLKTGELPSDEAEKSEAAIDAQPSVAGTNPQDVADAGTDEHPVTDADADGAAATDAAAADSLTIDAAPASLGDEMVEEIAAQQSDTALVGLGVDIIEIARMEAILKRTPHFKERVYTEDERAYCEAKHNPAVHYALFFAAKEAVLKALGTGFQGMGINDVQVAHNRYGKPQAVLSGNAAAEAVRQGIHEVHLSLSYTHTTGVASAVAVRKENIPDRADETRDAQARLEEQFKNMRAMLDDIDAKLTELGA